MHCFDGQVELTKSTNANTGLFVDKFIRTTCSEYYWVGVNKRKQQKTLVWALGVWSFCHPRRTANFALMLSSLVLVKSIAVLLCTEQQEIKDQRARGSSQQTLLTCSSIKQAMAACLQE